MYVFVKNDDNTQTTPARAIKVTTIFCFSLHKKSQFSQKMAGWEQKAATLGIQKAPSAKISKQF
jgi:hypothetical protein